MKLFMTWLSASAVDIKKSVQKERELNLWISWVPHLLLIDRIIRCMDIKSSNTVKRTNKEILKCNLCINKLFNQGVCF